MVTLFFGRKKVLERSLKQFLLKNINKVKITGTYSPPFRELTKEEGLKMIDNINKFSPDFLWVLVPPKQENWIMKYKKLLNVKFLVGVRAAFDFHTGNVKRAPVFYQKLGLEWLYRTAFQS